MRIVLKALFKSIVAMLTIAMMALTLMPASDAEAAALGRDKTRVDLVQMRLAKVMMTVAPDFVVARYADATGVPPSIIRDMLNAKANGQPIIPRNTDFYAEQATSAPTAQQSSPSRRTEAGGALFARPD